MDTLLTATLLIVSYLFGTLPGARIVCHLFKLGSPLTQGSGNPGATNVYRLGGFLPALITLVIDAGKGVAAVYLVQVAHLSVFWQLSAAMLTILGHMYPVFSRFNGGKGVATTLGAGLVIAPALTLLLTSLWAGLLYQFRISAIASVTTALLSPVLAFWLTPSLTPFFMLLALLITFRHRHNFQKWQKGNATQPPSPIEKK